MGNDGYTGVFTTYTGVQPQPCKMIGTQVLYFWVMMGTRVFLLRTRVFSHNHAK